MDDSDNSSYESSGENTEGGNEVTEGEGNVTEASGDVTESGDFVAETTDAVTETGSVKESGFVTETGTAKGSGSVKETGSVNDEPDWARTSLKPSEEAVLHDMEEKGEITIPEMNFAEMPQPPAAHLPTEATGKFEGERGNSAFVPNSPEALSRMAEYGRSSVEYRSNNPDFSPFATHETPWGSLNCQVEIGHMTDQRQNPTWEGGRRPSGTSHDPSYDLGNFAQADNSLLAEIQKEHPEVTAKDVQAFRKQNGLTWHECADGKTMQLVPTEIHDACRHSGGVSEMSYRMEIGSIDVPEDEEK